VVGGWDDALASEVDKCIDKKVPTVVTDGDLPMSKRLTYLGTNWYNLGYQHGQYQCRYHTEAGLKAGQIGTISFLAASNFIQARQGLRDALAKECPGVKVVADEESGTNVEQVAANTAAIIQGHPDLTGMVGFDSEAGPGIVRAVTEAGKSGKIIITSNEAGRDFLESIKAGTVRMMSCASACRFSRETTSVRRPPVTCSCFPATWCSSRNARRSPDARGPGLAGSGVDSTDPPSACTTNTSRSLATPTTVPGIRGGWRRTTVPSAAGSAPGSGELEARA